MNRGFRFALAAGMAAALSSCAHNAIETRVDERLARETWVETAEDLNLRADQLINLTPGLSRTQRWELAALHDSTREKLKKIQRTALRLRAVLFEELMAVHYDSELIEAIKRRITAVEKERLDATFKALELASSALGHDPLPSRQRIMEWLLDPTAHPNNFKEKL